MKVSLLFCLQIGGEVFLYFNQNQTAEYNDERLFFLSGGQRVQTRTFSSRNDAFSLLVESLYLIGFE